MHSVKLRRRLLVGVTITLTSVLTCSWFTSPSYHWKYGFAKLSCGYLLVIEHGSAPWNVGWHLVQPWDNSHRVDPTYDDLLWERVVAWKIANTSWNRTVIPIWVIAVILVIASARVMTRAQTGRSPVPVALVQALERAAMVLTVLAIAYGPIDRWIAGQASFQDLHPIAYWVTRVLGLVTVALWARRRWARDLAAVREGCKACGYNLTGNVSGICPECGRPLEAGGLTYTGETPRTSPWR